MSWLDKPKSKSKLGLEAEKKAAKKAGAKPTIASGRFWFSKGDYETEDYLVEHKATHARQYVLKLLDFETIRKEALKQGKGAAMVVEFYNDSNEVRRRLIITEG